MGALLLVKCMVDVSALYKLAQFVNRCNKFTVQVNQGGAMRRFLPPGGE
jgi:hypothetical protein